MFGIAQQVGDVAIGAQDGGYKLAIATLEPYHEQIEVQLLN